MYTDFQSTSSHLPQLQNVMKGNSLQDFALMCNRQFRTRQELEQHTSSARHNLVQVRKALAESGYTLQPFTISQFSDKHDAVLQEIDILMRVAPEPWQLRAKVHFRRSTKEYSETIKVDSFLEIRSGGDIIYRKHIVEKIGAKNE